MSMCKVTSGGGREIRVDHVKYGRIYIRIRPDQTIDESATQISFEDRSKPCRHLGAEVEERVCEPCGGGVRVKVFECRVDTDQVAKCTVKKALEEGVRVCGGCIEYERVE